MPDPTSGDLIERELRYAFALGVVRTFKLHRTFGEDGLGYRRYVVTDRTGDVHRWTPAQVLAFTIGVRLMSERKDA